MLARLHACASWDYCGLHVVTAECQQRTQHSAWPSQLEFSIVHVSGLFRAGELFAFGYNVGAQPHCTYCVIDPKGDLMLDVPVHLPK